MKKILIISILLFTCVADLFAWGFWGHQRINRMACFTVHSELFPFYKKHIEYLTVHSVDPDKRRYSDPEEACRHYIDLDHFGDHPFDSIPERWKDAVEKYSEDTLKSYGIVPWHINKMYYQLVRAFTEKDVSRIIYYSANIGHYIADSHVPLHCTENYNGQKTNQTGIHGFWESRLPELFGHDYDYFVGKAMYIEDVQKFCWQNIKESYAALDSVLLFEKMLNDEFDTDKKYSFEPRGTQLVKVYSNEYSKNYHELLAGQVERRMQAAIIAVGSIWYTAWVNSGMPVLANIEAGDFVEEEMRKDSVKSFRDCE